MAWKASTAHNLIAPGTGLHIYMEPQIGGHPQQFMPPGIDLIISHPSTASATIHISAVVGGCAQFSDSAGNIGVMTRATPSDPPDPVRAPGLYSEYWIVR